MSEIIALTYDSAENALQAKQHFLLEREEHELKLEDCEVVFKDEKGNIKFEHELNPAQARKDSACSVGALIGFIFGLPFGVAGELIFPALGSALGYEIGALSVSKSDYGIDEGNRRPHQRRKRSSISADAKRGGQRKNHETFRWKEAEAYCVVHIAKAGRRRQTSHRGRLGGLRPERLVRERRECPTRPFLRRSDPLITRFREERRVLVFGRAGTTRAKPRGSKTR